MDSHEFTEWLAFYSLEPFGEERADVRSAIVASTTANVWSKKAIPLSAFMPRWDEPKRGQDWRHVKAYFMALAKRDRKGGSGK